METRSGASPPSRIGRRWSMARAYSQDLRDRVIDAALAGLPARQAAVRFGVGIATAIGWVGRARHSGERTARARPPSESGRATRTQQPQGEPQSDSKFTELALEA